MKASPLINIKRISEKERLQNNLDTRIKNINTLAEDCDYSNMIRNLADAIIFANELADIKADE